MLRLNRRDSRAGVGAVDRGQELDRVERGAPPSLDLGGCDRACRPDRVVDLDTAREIGVVGAAADGDGYGSRLNCESTYGGDLVSTWSVLRRSCKPRFRRPR
jgi:hypothetical protein